MRGLVYAWGMNSKRRSPRKLVLPWLMALGVLLLAYLPTLQTIPNGSEHYYMIDVGETQIVLNKWGTLHATGYPLYVMTGNLLVAGLRGLGVSSASAPAVVSLIWGGLALTLLYSVLVQVMRPALVVALAVALLGLTRTVWIHQVIAEIYSFGLLLVVGLLAVALWQPPIRNRLYWLALLGGVGVAHHRAVAMLIPALVYAAWPDLRALGRRLSGALAACFLLGLLGFAQYIYMPLRAQAGAAWVYGEPGTPAGLWDQFTGREAARFIGTPATFEGLLANIDLINQVLITDLTLPGLIAGLIGLGLGATRRERRKLAIIMLLSGGAAYVFHCLFYTDILSALILPILVSIAVGWALLAEAVVLWSVGAPRQVLWMAAVRTYAAPTALLLAALALGLTLDGQNRAFITDLTQDPTGVETIRLAEQTPPGSTLMLAWGPRHFAIGFARDVENRLQDITLVDHKADFAALMSQRPLITPAFTFYAQPISWWEARLGQPVFLYAAAPNLVRITTEPEVNVSGGGFGAQTASLVCQPEQIVLDVTWYSPDVPTRDLSVFVHLIDNNRQVVTQGDQAAPVYGWRPLTGWLAGENVRDVYVLARQADGVAIRYGLFTENDDESFENVVEYELAVECP